MKKFLFILAVFIFALPIVASADLSAGEIIEVDFSKPAEPACLTSNYKTAFTNDGTPIYYTLCDIHVGQYNEAFNQWSTKLIYAEGQPFPTINWSAKLTIVRPNTSNKITGIASFASYLVYADNLSIAECDAPANAGRSICLDVAHAPLGSADGNYQDTYTLTGNGVLHILDDQDLVNFGFDMGFTFDNPPSAPTQNISQNTAFTVNIKPASATLYVNPLSLSFSSAESKFRDTVWIQNFQKNGTGFTVNCTAENVTAGFTGLKYPCPTVNIKTAENFLMEVDQATAPQTGQTYEADIVITASPDSDTPGGVLNSPQTIHVSYVSSATPPQTCPTGYTGTYPNCVPPSGPGPATCTSNPVLTVDKTYIPNIGKDNAVTFTGTSSPTGQIYYWHGTDPGSSTDIYNGVADGTTNFSKLYNVSTQGTYTRYFTYTQSDGGACTSNTVTVTAAKPGGGPTSDISCSVSPSFDSSVPYQFKLSVNNAKSGYNYSWSAPCNWVANGAGYQTLDIDCGGQTGLFSATVTEAATGKSATCPNFCSGPDSTYCQSAPPPPPPGSDFLKAAKGTMQTFTDCDEEYPYSCFSYQQWRPVEPYASTIIWPAPLTLEDTDGRRAVGFKFDAGSYTFDGVRQRQFDCTGDGTYEKTLTVTQFTFPGDTTNAGSTTDGICNYPTAGTYTARARALDAGGGVALCATPGYVEKILCEGTATIKVGPVIPPTVTLTHSGTLYFKSGNQYILAWEVTHADSCVASSTPEHTNWKNGQSKSTLGGTQNIGGVNTTTIFHLTCTGPGGTVRSEPPAEIRVGSDYFKYPMNLTLPDYCASGPAATIAWEYNVPSSIYNGQSAYEVEIDDNANFNSPEIKTGKVLSSNQSYSTGVGVLQYNKTYNFHVRVWNDFNQPSPSGSTWSAPTTWDTPKHAYPTADYTFSPASPQSGSAVQFTDQTTFSGGGTRAWAWNFGDGNTATQQNPSHAFTNSGSYTVTDTATDGDGYSCSSSKTVTVQSSPTASNPQASQPNYCASGPAAAVSWTYSDPSNSPQSAYQVQIDDQSSFNSPEVDSGRITSSNNSYSSGPGILQFNTTYEARVKVWNSQGAESAWVKSGSFKTPKHAYPQPDFIWSPTNPAQNQIVQFTDQTIFFDSGGVGQRSWAWTFGDSPSSTIQNPTHTYADSGVYTVNLTATDKDGYTCDFSPPPGKTITIKPPIPIWKEVSPKP
ncbi:MAG: PKD domain-containing protein [bacterium]|nr:PKD domain-containing protein [bacterium]